MADADSANCKIADFEPVSACWFLTGPTASGKTEIGLELAERIGAEIISLDSMALYRGMDIGTAKPTPEQLRRIPHHLVDIIDPDEEYSLSQYVAAAHRVIEQIRQRGAAVLFVGGTPLYLKALLRGLYPGPPADWQFRQEIEEELKFVGIEALHARLQQVDPLAAARLHPHDKRRIIRALEVHRATGRPLSHRQVQFDESPPERGCRAVTLAWSRAELQARIDARVEQMFADGWVAEVRRLQQTYANLGRTASQAVGYREILEHLRGEIDLPQTIELVKRRTRQFARRQDTWFRSLSECRRLVPVSSADPAAVAEQILQQ